MSGSTPDTFDVVVLGGSLAGAASALLLARRRPGLRIVVVEKSTRFGRRVGEATVEVSGFFLARVLGLTRHLNECHLAKQGMRFWFNTGPDTPFDHCSEIGGRYLARMPAWQVDRSTLDEEVLRLCAGAGVTVLRPAKVHQVRLTEGGRQRVTVSDAAGTRELTARWVIDGTGLAALLARQEGWLRRNTDHPTSAIWTRWRGVKDWDGLELAGRYPEWAAACKGIRATATNHLMGDGWWAWCIPLKGGDTSIGVVFDHRRVSIPPGESLSARLRAFLSHHPVARELLADAEPVEGDAHWRSQLAYVSTRFAGDGFVLVGDAAGFIDPFYSPGMDWLSYTVSRGVQLIDAALSGEPIKERIARHNADFSRSYARWFDGVYRDKYDVFGDFELLSVAFHLDLGMYYAGVVSQPVARGARALEEPVFSTGPSGIPYRIMRFYNRRLARMGRERRRRGVFGRRNAGQRFLLNGFLPERSTGRDILRALTRYAALELREGWRSWWRGEEVPEPLLLQTTASEAPPARAA